MARCHQAAPHRAASQLPPGLPPAALRLPHHGRARDSALYVRRGRTIVVEEDDPDVLFTPVGVVPYAPVVYGTPILPGSSTLPGYYGNTFPTAMTAPITAAPKLAAVLEPPALRLRRLRLLLTPYDFAVRTAALSSRDRRLLRWNTE